VEAFISELVLANPGAALDAFRGNEPCEEGGVLMTWGKGDHGKLGHGHLIALSWISALCPASWTKRTARSSRG
jgi:hypothetical protein